MQTQYPVINWSRAATRCNFNLTESIEFLSLVSTPHDEICTQAGHDEDLQIMECTALINQLIRGAGQPDPGAEFFIIENTGHEFGPYYEAGIFYVPTPEDQEEENGSEIYAMVIEQNIPDKWDSEALQELKKAGHPNYQPAKVIRLKTA